MKLMQVKKTEFDVIRNNTSGINYIESHDLVTSTRPQLLTPGNGLAEITAICHSKSKVVYKKGPLPCQTAVDAEDTLLSELEQ